MPEFECEAGVWNAKILKAFQKCIEWKEVFWTKNGTVLNLKYFNNSEIFSFYTQNNCFTLKMESSKVWIIGNLNTYTCFWHNLFSLCEYPSCSYNVFKNWRIPELPWFVELMEHHIQILKESQFIFCPFVISAFVIKVFYCDEYFKLPQMLKSAVEIHILFTNICYNYNAAHL